MQRIFLFLALLATVASASAQRSADALLVETTSGPYVAGNEYRVSLQLRSPEAATVGVRDVRDASVFIDFDDAALSFSSFSFSAYSGDQPSYAGGTVPYIEGSVLEAQDGTISVNVLNDFRSSEVGQTLSSDYTEVVEVTFTVLDPAVDPGFAKDAFEVFYTDSGSPVQYTEGAFVFEAAPVVVPTVTLSASPLEVGEAGGVSTVTATLSETIGTAVDVTLGFAGTAANADYTASATSITIPAGQTAASITVTGTDDDAIEGDETVVVSIEAVTNADEDGDQSASITLADDDTAAVTVEATANATEGGAAGTFRFSIDQALGTDLEVAFAVSGDTGDVAALGTTATILLGNTSVDIQVSAIDDAVLEAAESVTVTLASTNSAQAVIGSPNQATVDVIDNNTATISVSASAQAAEPGTDGAFTITSTAAAAFDIAITVEVGGTATAGSDYEAIGTTVVLEAGETTVSVPVVVANDDAFEGDETVTLALSSTNAAAATVSAPSSATVNITDDDEAGIVVSPASVTVSETGTTATFNVTLPQSPAADVTIAVASSDTGEATVSTASLTFTPSGALTQTVTVTGVNDDLDDNDQSVTIVLEAASSADGDFDGVDPLDVNVTVSDDDAPPTVALTAAATSVLEGASTLITATLTGAATVADVTVSLVATGDASRFSVPAEIVIPAGQISASVTFSAPNRNGDQADLEVGISVSAVTNAVEATPQAVSITVEDDDPTLVTLSASPTRVAEAGGVSIVTATLTTPAPSPVTVALGFSTDSAVAADYTASATEIVMGANETSGTVTITAIGDALEGEGDETLAVSIVGVTGGDTTDGTLESGEQSVSITIQETPPSPVIAFDRNQTTVSEGAGSVDLELSLDRALEAGATVRVRLMSGDSADLNGFDRSDVLIPASASRAFVTIPVTDDQEAEGDETFQFVLEVVSGDLEVGDRASTTLVVTDNDGQPVTVTVPVRDGDGDGVEDGGLRFFSVPVGGLTAGDIATEAGGTVSVIDSRTGALVEAESGQTLLAGQLVVVDVAPGAELSFRGSDPSTELAQQAVVLEDDDEVRVLVPVANLTDAAIPVSGLEVAGGTLSDVALVFDEIAGTFRPVSLSSLSASGLFPLAGVVLQVIPDDLDNPDVTVSLVGTASPDGSDATRASFAPTSGETAVVLSLRPSAASGRLAAPQPASTVVFRVLEGADTAGLDRFDGVSVSTSSVDLAFDGGLPLAALSADPSALEGGLDLALAAQAAPGSYEINADVLGDRQLEVFLVDRGAVVSLTSEPYAFTVAPGDDLSDRFGLGVAARVTVANEDAALEGSIGHVFPNPTAGAAWLDLEVEAQTVRIKVYDLLGRAVASVFDGAHAGGALRLAVDTSALAPGAYVVRVTGESFAATRRLSVAR